MLNTDHDRHTEFLRAFTANEQMLRAFIRRLVPLRGDADDIMQEVAVVLWEKFSEFEPNGSFRAWACGIAKYKVLSWIRDKGRDRLVLNTEVVSLLAGESLKKESQLEDQREALESCLEKMSKSERDLLVQAYQSESKIQEVAERSGRTVAGFYQWLYRVRQILLDCVNRTLTQEFLT